MTSFSNPAHSLKKVREILELFSAVSYYKVNVSKSSILSLAMDHKTKTQIQKLLPYPWVRDAIQYLGIMLTNPLSHLYSNFEPLLNSFTQEMNRLKKFFLS